MSPEAISNNRSWMASVMPKFFLISILLFCALAQPKLDLGLSECEKALYQMFSMNYTNSMIMLDATGMGSLGKFDNCLALDNANYCLLQVKNSGIPSASSFLSGKHLLSLELKLKGFVFQKFVTLSLWKRPSQNSPARIQQCGLNLKLLAYPWMSLLQ